MQNYLAKLTDKLESNRKKAEEMRERMVSIIVKLELGEDEKQKVYHELNGHTPTMLQEVSYILY